MSTKTTVRSRRYTAWFALLSRRLNLESFVVAASCLMLGAAHGRAAAAESAAVNFALSDSAVTDSGAAPSGVSASDWSGIRDAYEAGRHAVAPCAGGWQARNPGQRWRTHFDGRGFIVTPDSADCARTGAVGGPCASNVAGWSWGLELVSFGRAGDERPAPAAPACIDAAGQHVAYEWDDTVTEWYINDSRGLEHGYTVGCVPRRTDSPDRLHLTLAVRGNLLPRISPDGSNVQFANAAGAAVINYAGLTVLDADDRSLPVCFESSGGALRLTIDDTGARYPLTIDPIAQQAYLTASYPDQNDQFGWDVAISGDTVVVGAPHEDSNATGANGDQADDTRSDSGAAYVFVRSGASWSQQAYLKASNTGAGDYFGHSVAISGNTVVVGAVAEDSHATGVNGNQSDNSATDSGAAYVFVRSGTVWTQQAYLKASNTDAVDLFGAGVAISNDTVVVGANREDSNATGVNGNQSDNSIPDTGAAYVFVRSGAVWTQQAYLKASNTAGFDEFGWPVAISDNTVVIGAQHEDSNATGVNGNEADNSAGDAGAAYVFVRTGTSWSQHAYLKASNTERLDRFGSSISISGDTAVVGAYLEDSGATGVNGDQADNSAQDSGAAYVFVRDGSVWSQQAYLKASNSGTGDYFGAAVGVSGETVVVGAPVERSNATGVNGNQADNSAAAAGAVYVFVRNAASWSQQAYVKASNTHALDEFGCVVAISGDTLVSGAIGRGSFSGAAYIFAGLGPRPPCQPCDTNCNGTVNQFDIQPFVELLISPTPTPCSPCAGDANANGTVNPFDINAFLACLSP